MSADEDDAVPRTGTQRSGEQILQTSGSEELMVVEWRERGQKLFSNRTSWTTLDIVATWISSSKRGRATW